MNTGNQNTDDSQNLVIDTVIDHQTCQDIGHSMVTGHFFDLTCKVMQKATRYNPTLQKALQAPTKSAIRCSHPKRTICKTSSKQEGEKITNKSHTELLGHGQILKAIRL